MHTYKVISINIILTLSVLSCYAQEGMYNLNKPTKVVTLNSELNEISGLHSISESELIAIQDEEGIIYFIKKNNGKILKTIKFGKDADYEGVTAVKKRIYILESNGDIHRYKNDKTSKYHFKKEGKFDFEGLCYDDKNDQLLVACKTHGKNDKKDHIYIYGFDISENKYHKSPIYKIKKEKSYKKFWPSGIAVHPNGNIYLLSSRSKMLMIISPSGDVIKTQALMPYLFNQPEGISFSENGDLYISNEKRKSKPTLLKFKMQ